MQTIVILFLTACNVIQFCCICYWKSKADKKEKGGVKNGTEVKVQ